MYSVRDRGEGGNSVSRSGSAIEELREAFELAEQTTPGVSEVLVREIFRALLISPDNNHSDLRLSMIMDKFVLR